LKRLDDFIKARNKIAQRYNKELNNLSLQLPKVLPENYSTFHLYIVRIKTDKVSRSYNEIFTNLRERGIEVNLHYMPIHLQPYYRNLGFESNLFFESEKYAKQAITLPIFPGLTQNQQNLVVDLVKENLDV
jgi:dTDP-4-amino-4,6-dideoxygalactose transaminase